MRKVLKLSVLALVGGIFLNSVSSSKFDMQAPDSGMQDGKYNFKYTGVVNTGNDVMPLVGQLSKDGKSLYFTSQNPRGNKQIYKMDRASAGESFSSPSKLAGDINDGSYDIIMPTVSADEKTMVFVNSANGMQNGNDLYIATADASGKFTNVRSLDEINDPSLSDSYPWLSPSGLRVYFTKQKGAMIKFLVADRKDSKSEFANMHELNFTVPKISNNLSCFLTNNELEIYALSGEKIYHATRASITDTFGAAEEIAKTSSDGFMSGITMTDDSKELYVFNSVGFRNTQILRFINSATKAQVLNPGK